LAWWRTLVTLRGIETPLLEVWAGGAALVALAARIAGRRRWTVAVPMLLMLGGLAALWYYAMASMGGGASPWVAVGVLLGTFVIGSPILLVPAAAPTGGRATAAASAAEPPSPRLHYRELWVWLPVLAVLAAVLVPSVRAGGIRRQHLEDLRRDVLPAFEDLARSDILARSQPVVWRGLELSRWSPLPRIMAWGEMSGTGVRLSLDSIWGEPRQFGEAGEAEGLRVDGLHIWVPQPPSLSAQEAGDLQVVKPLLASIGLRPELVSRLSPEMTATYRGVTYSFEVNKAWSQAESGVSIRCSGVRSAASP